MSLAPEHLADLQKSGLKEEIITAAGIRSLSPADLIKKVTQSLGYVPSDLKSAYEIPYETNGFDRAPYFRLKCFPTITFKDGEKAKYLSPKGTPSAFYIPPGETHDLLKDSSAPLFIVEGEKKTLAAVQAGLRCAIGIPGVWGWLRKIDEQPSEPIEDLDVINFQGRQTPITPDGDFRDEMKNVGMGVYALAKELEARGATVEIVVLPDSETGKVGLDDFLLEHTFEEFLNLPRIKTGDKAFDELRCLSGKLTLKEWWVRWKQKNETVTPHDILEIDVDDKDLVSITQKCWDAIKADNKKAPKIFRFGNFLARVEADDMGNPVVRGLDKNSLRFELAKRANFYKWLRKEKLPALPPMHAIEQGVLVTPEKPVPILRRVVTTPVFSQDGTLITEPGYCGKCLCFYAPDSYLSIPEVNLKPSTEDVEAAKTLILDDLLIDFPFETQTDRAHAVALIILPPARDMIDGCTPLHGTDASTPGTGKGLLTNVSCGIWSRNLSNLTESKDEESFRKQIFSKLRSAPMIVRFDNLKKRLESASLEAALTSRYFEDRVLGVSEVVAVPVSCVWIVTGNNLSVSSEIARRFIRIRLNPKSGEPWLRDSSEFKHPELEKWAQENRGRLIWAALTLVQAWIAAGRPKFKGQRLGSFESWSEIIGGILENAGIDGFLGNVREFYAQADLEFQTYSAFIQAWHEKFVLDEVGVSDLFNLAVEAGLDLGRGTDRSARTRLGIILSKMRDRCFGEFAVKKCGIIHGLQKWRLTLKPPF